MVDWSNLNVFNPKFIYLIMFARVLLLGIIHTGYYVYIETSGPPTGYTARLISPLFRGVQGDDTEKFCVVFYYHMYGLTIGQLNVYQRNATTPTDLGSPIWSMSGARGDMWKGAEAELFTPLDFNVSFCLSPASNRPLASPLNFFRTNCFQFTWLLPVAFRGGGGRPVQLRMMKLVKML